MKNRVKSHFARHELWALNMAERMPFLAIFFAASLWIRAIPCVPVLVAYGFLMLKWPILTSVPSLVLGLAFCFFVAPWFFRWYFLALGLMLGKTGMAATKRKQLEQGLMSLR